MPRFLERPRLLFGYPFGDGSKALGYHKNHKNGWSDGQNSKRRPINLVSRVSQFDPYA